VSKNAAIRRRASRADGSWYSARDSFTTALIQAGASSCLLRKAWNAAWRAGVLDPAPRQADACPRVTSVQQGGVRMGHVRLKLAAATAAVCALGVGGVALAGGGGEDFEGTLTGYEEVPAVSTGASGKFAATVRVHHGKIWWKLHYEGLTDNVTQAHIHFAQRDVNGGIAVWLCSNVPTAPAGTQPCPAPPATISGVATEADVVGPADQGIAPGQFDELVAAMRAGLTYANVHSSAFPAGEIRAQLEPAP
jgi:hypothetical protein